MTETTNYRAQIRNVVKHITTQYVAELPRNIYDPSKRTADPSVPATLMPITTTLTILNSCMGRNTLIEGPKGTAKTTLAQVVGSMLFQLPVEFFEYNRVVGVQGATVNDIYGTIHLPSLNAGKVEPFLYLPFLAPYLIMDEINRNSELEQNRIREGIAKGAWKIAGQTILTPKQVVVGALNPEEYRGTHALNENLVDNFGITLEHARTQPLLHHGIIRDAEERISEELGAEQVVRELQKFYEKSKLDPDSVREHIAQTQLRTLALYRERGVPVIANGFIDAIKKEIREVNIDGEAKMFYYAVLAEMNFSHKYGLNRMQNPKDATHDQAYLSSRIEEGVFGRFTKDWEDTAKAIAWYLGKQQVEVDDFRAAFTYSAGRRVQPTPQFRSEIIQTPGELDPTLKIAKALVDHAWKNYADLRGDETNPSITFNNVRKAVNIITGTSEGTLDNAVRTLQSADHPLAKWCLEAIGKTD